MTVKKEIITRVHLIQKLLTEKDYEDIKCHLAELESTDVTVDLLQETDMVTVVYRVLKTCPSQNLKKKAKLLLSKWKVLYRNAYHGPKHPQNGISLEKKKGDEENLKLFAEKPMEASLEHSSLEVLHSSYPLPLEGVQKEAYSALKIDISPGQRDNPCCHLGLVKNVIQQEKEQNTSALRSKCTELLYRALADSITSQANEDGVTWDIAKKIEEGVFFAHTNNDKKYKICIRSKVSNLKNPKNPLLRQHLLSGTLSPNEFVKMTAQEMASDELRRLRASYTELSVLEHQLPQGVEGTTTNKIKCRRCDNFSCTVTAIPRGTLFLPGWVQNGKPDDDLMTFVICNVCGEKWYNNGWVCL
ncbi:transcription elongation factor A N-terminal and central domain-containing protein [Pleurodeles waltl]|uniref:transcription elongation factor A N-terminal and central domain-containing protein n=1 Tax=Pleurodeles waltl TaxID=8319 RepID=UPI0037096C20